jgi:hypothetical protein
MGLRIARPLLLNSWINASRTKMKVERTVGHPPNFWDDVHAWLDRHAPGKTLVDVGGMYGGAWGSFDAEERGARATTALDVTPPTDACLAEQERRGTHTRFVTGDLHDVDALSEVGVHDIVLCSGVIYHSPNPCLTLERLRDITGEYLLLGSEVLQEVPGIPQACVFYPALSEAQRLAFAAPVFGIADGLSTPFDPDLDYSNWWWGLSRSALRAMLIATGWDVLELKTYQSAPGYRALFCARPNRTVATITTPASATRTRPERIGTSL